MFESNQSIMLMGTAGSIDFAANLANANSNVESESINNMNDSSVFLMSPYVYLLFIDVFGNWLKKFRQHLLC